MLDEVKFFKGKAITPGSTGMYKGRANRQCAAADALDLSAGAATNALGLNFAIFDETDSAGAGTCARREAGYYDTSVLL